jgi:hypothetical protein
LRYIYQAKTNTAKKWKITAIGLENHIGKSYRVQKESYPICDTEICGRTKIYSTRKYAENAVASLAGRFNFVLREWIEEIHADALLANEKPKRITTTSTQVKRRYNEKTYDRVFADLPKELVANFKRVTQEQGTSVASVLKKALEQYIAEHPPKSN